MNIRKSLLIAFSSSYAQIGLQFVASLFVARLLTPHEFGVFSLAMVIIYLADALRNFGVAGYVIQERELTAVRLNSATGLNFLASWGMGLVMAALAAPLSDFFKAPEVTGVIWLLTANFFLIPFSSTVMGCLKRNLMFDRVAKIEVSGAVIQSVGGVLLAWLGFSYYSMAIASVVSTLALIGITWMLRPTGLAIWPSLADVRRVIGFGSLSTLNYLLIVTGRRMPDFFLARLLNLESLAFFSRAGGLIEMFNRLLINTVTTVAMPHFAAQSRSGSDINQGYLIGMSHVTVLAWPFLLVITATAPELVPLLYGDQWGQVIPLAQILCLGELLLVPFYLQGQLLIATGRMGTNTLINLATVAIRIPPLALLAPRGLIAVTIGLAAVNGLILILLYLVEIRLLNQAAGAMWRTLGPSLLVSLAVCFGILAVEWFGPAGMLALPVHLAVALCLWLLAIGWARHPIGPELARGLTSLRTLLAQR